MESIMISDTMAQKIQSLPSILSIHEVADFFDLCYLTIYRLIQKNELIAYKDDEGNWCITRHDLKRFCSKNCNL